MGILSSFFGSRFTLQQIVDDPDAFCDAIIAGEHDLIREALEQGVDPNEVANKSHPPLSVALAKKQQAIVDLLLDAGVDVNHVSESGMTALHVAIKNGNSKAVTILLESGADPKITFASPPISAMQIAFERGDYAIVKQLIEAGVSPDSPVIVDDERPEYNGTTGLIAAVMLGDPDLTEFFIHFGADVNATKGDDMSALGMAACGGFTQIVEKLLEAGADPNYRVAVEGQNYSPAGFAEIRGHTELAEFLESKEDRIAPTAEEVARRVLALREVLVGAVSAAGEPIVSHFNQAGVDLPVLGDELLEGSPARDYLSDEERQLLTAESGEFSDKMSSRAIWQLESTAVLLWALGLLESFPNFESRADLKSMMQTLLELPSANFEDFIAGAKLISLEEIQDKREIAELWHWRAQIQSMMEADEPFAEKFSRQGHFSYDDMIRAKASKIAAERMYPAVRAADIALGETPYRELSVEDLAQIKSISFERHFALNWLCGYSPSNSWELTPTDTH